ncbi:hypothetical protein Mtc_2051 [Methanocella conradii HZ254]|uniref:GxxExxY protein n=1 Tax=Methanocella conradii (strain DSM 24694 / JCM 17849 / CGMCC 1.5162 / HZ254) TaxID=1041930 RepID=H8I7C4_METCZ|nr:GxxExxY protein [Methanocella conradii]AFD00790.1 hypothetical protein Mtc_2051 [Methanocella conradii HZ254]
MDSTSRSYEPIPEKVEKTASLVIDAAYAVHTGRGPGLLESVYEGLSYELMKKGAIVECQVMLPIFYDNIRLKSSLRIDLLVNQCLIVIKSIEAILPVHVAQVLTYLKLSGCRLALLINFNTTSLNNGVKRIIL